VKTRYCDHKLQTGPCAEVTDAFDSWFSGVGSTSTAHSVFKFTSELAAAGVFEAAWDYIVHMWLRAGAWGGHMIGCRPLSQQRAGGLGHHRPLFHCSAVVTQSGGGS
jgi:hypothetical protein